MALTSLAALAAPSAFAATPTPEVGAVSEVSYASAHVTGTVKTGGEDTYYTFETSTDGGATWSPFLYEGPVSGSEAQKVIPFDFTALKGGTSYEVRLVTLHFSDFVEVPSAAPNLQFTTLPVAPPTADETADAKNITFTTAVASGKVTRPSGNSDHAFDAICRVEWVSEEQFASIGFEFAASIPCQPSPVEAEGQSEVEAEITGLTENTTYHYRITVENAGGSESRAAANTFTTLDAVPPSVTALPVTAHTSGSALIEAEINPNGAPTQGYLEYSADDGVIWTSVPEPPITLGEGTTPVIIARNVAGLQPNLEYQLRARAENPGGITRSSPPVTFKTDPVPPTTQTVGAGLGGSAGATLAGQVNPRNSTGVTYQFQWGEVEGPGDETYEQVAPATPEALGVQGNTPHPVSAQIADLRPETVYHYRLIASSAETGLSSVGLDKTFTTRPRSGMPPPGGCSNESSRVGPSAALPDCRAYELVTPTLNNARLFDRQGQVLPDGSAIQFWTVDAPDKAKGVTVRNPIVSRRGADGWSVESIMPPQSVPVQALYENQEINFVSADFSHLIIQSAQPLAGPFSHRGSNFYRYDTSDGTAESITSVGTPIAPFANIFTGGQFSYANPDASQIFFRPCLPQVPNDPTGMECPGTTYVWEGAAPHLIGILPGETLSPNIATLAGGKNGDDAPFAPVSSDGEFYVFDEVVPGVGPGPLFLRIHNQSTVEVAASQKSTPDPNPFVSPQFVGMAPDGSVVYFTSKNELTDDANTGESEGVSNDRGADLYSYDVASGVLSDLTVDTKPADAETGAAISEVVGMTTNGSYIYLIAEGNLAAGGVSGEKNLYVLHGGAMTYVGPGGRLVVNGTSPTLRLLDGGRTAFFLSRDSLTGYDNEGAPGATCDTLNPNPLCAELFKYTFGGGIECLSCREGHAPTASVGFYTIADAGSRVFIETVDALTPAATNGRANVFEVEGGETHLISSGSGSSPSELIGSSESGDDVFITTHEELVPGQGPLSAIYDARVNGTRPAPAPAPCQGETCRGPSTSASPSATPQSDKPGEAGVVFAPKNATTTGSKLTLRISVPSAGKITVSGKSLVKATKNAQAAGVVAVPVKLTKSADRRRKKKGVFSSRASVSFLPSAGPGSKTVVKLEFRGSHRKGQK